MRFGPSNASSVDLCVRDLVLASRFRTTTTVICCENETLFPDLNIITYPPAVDASKRRKAAFAANTAKTLSANLIVVHQHLPTAAALARRTATPVILHKHNMTKAIPGDSVRNKLRRSWRLHQYRSLAGIIFVSGACRNAFLSDWPEVTIPTEVVYNGLDFGEWRPLPERTKEILCVGRAAPEKGIKEAALAMAAVLENNDRWSGRLVLAEPFRFPKYMEEILVAVRSASSRITIEYSLPYSVVKQRFESAAIVVVPSKWDEPFGRTALEAHAGGSAIISSGSGGLREVSGENAIYLPENFTSIDIAQKLTSLMTNDAFRTTLATNGHKCSERRFSLSEISKISDNFYSQLAC